SHRNGAWSGGKFDRCTSRSHPWRHAAIAWDRALMNMAAALARYTQSLASKPMAQEYGHLLGFNGLVVEADGPDARIGELCEIDALSLGRRISAEVVGFRDGRT